MSKYVTFVTGIRHPLLTTWTLWQHLLVPSRHPLFSRVNAVTGAPYSWMRLTPLAGGLACGSVSLLLLQLQVPIALLALVALIAFSTVYAGAWAASISLTTARAKEQRTFDLYCLSPSGTLGASWAIGTAIMHRHDLLGWLTLVRCLISIALLFVLLMALATATLREQVASLWPFAWLLLDIVVLAAAAYGEHIQSVVMGSLIGMLTPVFVCTRFEACLGAAAGFLSLQVVTSLAPILAVMLVFPDWMRMYSAVQPADISPLALSLLLFYLTREGLNIVLWRTLAYQLNGSPADWTQR